MAHSGILKYCLRFLFICVYNVMFCVDSSQQICGRSKCCIVNVNDRHLVRHHKISPKSCTLILMNSQKFPTCRNIIWRDSLNLNVNDFSTSWATHFIHISKQEEYNIVWRYTQICVYRYVISTDLLVPCHI